MALGGARREDYLGWSEQCWLLDSIEQAAYLCCCYCCCCCCCCFRLDVLELAMRKLVKDVVPAELFAAKLTAVCLKPKLPR